MEKGFKLLEYKEKIWGPDLTEIKILCCKCGTVKVFTIDIELRKQATKKHRDKLMHIYCNVCDEEQQIDKYAYGFLIL